MYVAGSKTEIVERYCIDHEAWGRAEDHSSCRLLEDVAKLAKYSVIFRGAPPKKPNVWFILDILRALREKDKSTHELSRNTSLAPQTVSGYFDYLEGAGLIKTRREQHRGVVEEARIASITDKGRKIFADLQKPMDELKSSYEHGPTQQG